MSRNLFQRQRCLTVTKRPISKCKFDDTESLFVRGLVPVAFWWYYWVHTKGGCCRIEKSVGRLDALLQAVWIYLLLLKSSYWSHHVHIKFLQGYQGSVLCCTAQCQSSCRLVKLIFWVLHILYVFDSWFILQTFWVDCVAHGQCWWTLRRCTIRLDLILDRVVQCCWWALRLGADEFLMAEEKLVVISQYHNCYIHRDAVGILVLSFPSARMCIDNYEFNFPSVNASFEIWNAYFGYQLELELPYSAIQGLRKCLIYQFSAVCLHDLSLGTVVSHMCDIVGSSFPDHRCFGWQIW